MKLCVLTMKYIQLLSKVLFRNPVFLQCWVAERWFYSNHPSRFDYICSSVRRRLCFATNDDRPTHYCQFRPCKNVIVLGDSHVEYLSRPFYGSGGCKVRAYWLGPWLMASLVSPERSIALRERLIGSIERFGVKKVVLSFGSIDVRCAFYELSLIDGSLETVVGHFRRGLATLIQSIEEVRSCYPAVEFAIVGVLPIVREGSSPPTLHEVRKLKKYQQFPFLGRRQQFDEWVKLSNELISEGCKAGRVRYVEPVIPKIGIASWFELDEVHIKPNRVIDLLPSLIDFLRK